MKASFRFTNPNMLAEAQAGDLFVPLGPDLVECVCALRCLHGRNGPEADMPPAARFNPDARLPIVVVACRVGKGEPEYYPPGYVFDMFGAAPIQFLQQCEPLQLQPRIERQPEAAHRDPAAPLYDDLDAMQQHMDRIHVVSRQRIDALRALRRKLHVRDLDTGLESTFGAGAAADLARSELASKL